MREEIRDAFAGVRAEEALKRRTKARLARAINGRPRRAARMGRLAAALACLALLAGGSWLYLAPVSAVALDINPSLELGVNRFDRVVTVEGVNAEGEALARAVSVKYRDYAEALEILLASADVRPYLADGAPVSIAVIGSSEEKGAEMLKRVSACGFAQGPNTRCLRGNREEAAAARAAGLPYGKYRAYLELRDLQPDIAVEDVRDWSMRQFRDRIAALRGGAGDGGNGGNGNGNGGSGNGNGSNGNGGNGNGGSGNGGNGGSGNGGSGSGGNGGGNGGSGNGNRNGSGGNGDSGNGSDGGSGSGGGSGNGSGGNGDSGNGNGNGGGRSGRKRRGG